MLKRTGHIFIAVLLIFATSGVTIYRHYCCGRLVETSVYSVTKHCCETNCPGCRNEIINLRVADQFESYQNRVDLKPGYKTLLEQHSLPTLLAFLTVPQSALISNKQGDHSLKPNLNALAAAGTSRAFLQVFLL
jgi:hypothetical protein